MVLGIGFRKDAWHLSHPMDEHLIKIDPRLVEWSIRCLLQILRIKARHFAALKSRDEMRAEAFREAAKECRDVSAAICGKYVSESLLEPIDTGIVRGAGVCRERILALAQKERQAMKRKPV